MKAINPSEPARAINRAIVMAAASGSGDSDLRQRQLVFVYGSLKRSQANHHHLAGSRFLGAAQLHGLALYDLGPFPMAIICDESSACLHGELYAVSAEQLAELDRFEGAPRLYERQRHVLSDGRPVWVYVGRARQVRHSPAIADGHWRGAQPSGAVLLLGLAALLLGSAVSAGDLRHGQERVAIANRIGREQLLTKNRLLQEANSGDTTSLYRWSDIQRLCRRQ